MFNVSKITFSYYELTPPAAPPISVSVDPESVIVPNMAPYNVFTITCTAVLPGDVNLLWSFTWIDAITEQEFIPNASVNITTSTNIAVATSVLHVTEENAGIFQPVCIAQVSTVDMEDISTESSPGVNVTVTGTWSRYPFTLMHIPYKIIHTLHYP